MNKKSILDLVEFNPKRTIKKGTIAPFIEMASLPESSRDIGGITKREFKGGGAKFQNGDTLFARITPCLENGKTAKVTALEDGIVGHGSTEFIIMSPRNPSIDEDYIYYLARLPEFRAYAQARMEGTSGRQRVSWQSLSEFTLEIPETDIRKSAGNTLRAFDDKIQLNQQINQTLEQMAQAIFKSWFVDFDPVNTKIAAKERWLAMQPMAESASPVCYADEAETLPDLETYMNLAAMQAISGKDEEALACLQQEQPEQHAELWETAALFPSTMQDCELGEIPEGWEVLPLSKMVNLIGGGTPKKSEPTFWNGEICWFSVKDVPSEGNVFVVDTEDKITDEGLRRSSTKLLPLGATIITARGTVGKLALTGISTAMNQSCYGVVARDGTGPYLNYLRLAEAVDTLKRNTHGAVFDTITRSTFDTAIQPRSCLALRQRFEQTVAPMFEAIRNYLTQSNTLSEARDSLLPKLLSGELRVTDSETQIVDAEEVASV